MVDYEVNEQTLAIIPARRGLKSRVYEIGSSFVVDKSPNRIMEESCEYFGSSLLGRQKGTTNLIGVSHKAPIIVEETKELIFFPTSSPRTDKCAWVSLKGISKYYSEKNKIFIEFKDKRKVAMPASYGVIDNQILRATRLESVLRERKKIMNFK